MINENILKIASNTSNYGLKDFFTHKSILKNSKCGDKIKIEVVVKKNEISSMRYETESCIFCQASASLLSKSIRNKNTKVKPISLILDATIKNKNFKKLLKNKERINCIMLPFIALQKASNNAK